jgi:septal ring factor EnvC (AmiA/AmiB activator)
VADTASRDLSSALPPETAYAIRAWYTSVLTQTRQVRSDLEAQVDRLQSEIERVEQQMEAFDKSIDALGNVLDTVDDWIRKLTEAETNAPKSSPARKTTGPRRASTAGSTAARDDE